MKFKHYAQPVDSHGGFNFDLFVLMVVSAMICTGFCVFGYQNGVILMAVPCFIVALTCYGFIIKDILFFAIRGYRRYKRKPPHAEP